MKLPSLEKESPLMTTSWKIAGSYFEACNCEVACPCVFTSPPTGGECTVLIAWHIDQAASERSIWKDLTRCLLPIRPDTCCRSNGRSPSMWTNRQTKVSRML